MEILKQSTAVDVLIGSFVDLTDDALFGASAAGFDANQRVNVGSWLSTAVTISATTAKPEVDVYGVSDDATAANNLETACDGE